MPEQIDASPEDLAKAMFALPVDHEWEYEKDAKQLVVVGPKMVADGE